MNTPNPDNTLALIAWLLQDKGHLTEANLTTIREAQSKEDLPLEQVLIKESIATEEEIADAYSEYFLVPLYEPAETEVSVDSNLARQLPEKLCRDHLLAPVSVHGNMLDVAFSTPDSLHIVDELQLLTGLAVRPLIARLSVVDGLLGALYDDSAWANSEGGGSSHFEEVMDEDEEEEDGDDVGETLYLDQPPPPGRDGHIIRYVNQLFQHALRVGASDIHVEQFEDVCRVRLRVDGKLNETTPPPKSLLMAVVSRIKVLSKMDIAEKRIPQDGAIALKSGERRVDLRVNTVPAVYGEKVVMRILDRSAIPLDLSSLGLDKRQSTDLIESLNMPHGLILVTGPTGSGKSTTLYSCLNLLNQPDKNLSTVEDPVEYKFSGINQIQVKSQVGLTFSSALRAFLRQDPDVIMVGEVRDMETAQICMRAALTGHLVLSTLHTNDALAAVTRLADMEIEPFLLASTLRVLEAQRLVRRVCQTCRQPSECDSETAGKFGFDVGHTIYTAKGCPECRNTGYRGRCGVFEVIRITDELGELIQKSTPLPDLRRSADRQGMRLLRNSAMDKVREGVTSLEVALSISTSEEE